MPEYSFQSTTTKINYFTNNSESKEILFLIHGWTGGWELWKPVIDNFDKYKIYAIDLPGHNKSGWLKEYNLDEYCKPILEFIISLGKENIYLAGNSLGASISLQIASKLSIITHLLLEEPPWFSKEKGMILNNPNSDELIMNQQLKYKNGNNFISEHKPKWRTVIDAIQSYQIFDPEIFKINPFQGAIRAAYAFHHDIKIWQNAGDQFDWVWQDAPEISKSVEAKTVMIGGNINKGGLMRKDIADEVSKNINNSEVLIFDTGHNLRYEMPDEFNKILAKLIS